MGMEKHEDRNTIIRTWKAWVVEKKFGRINRTRLTMGPQAVAGIEYAYFKIPISAFMELEYFTTISRRIQAGVVLKVGLDYDTFSDSFKFFQSMRR